MIGLKYVVPPLEQLPEPPTSTPCAWVPLMNPLPPSPGSAHTDVRVSPLTTPPPKLMVMFLAWIVPQCQPVVLPYLQTDAPTGASVDPVITTEPEPPAGGTRGTRYQSTVLVTRMIE